MENHKSILLVRKKIKEICEIKEIRNSNDIIRLRIRRNSIQKIECLDSLLMLKDLDLESNQIREITGLQNNTKLKYLNLKDNTISEIKGLENLIELKRLDLSRNNIVEIKGLNSLTKLEELYLWTNQIKEISGMENLVNLKKLAIGSNQISKIEGLENLTKLEELNLEYNQIKKISGMENLINLKKLKIASNQISKIEGLENLTKLEELDLGYNNISEIQSLESLSNLKSLHLSRNNINEVKGLDALFNLQKLWLYGNKIKKIEGFENLKRIEYLDLDENQLSRIEGLEHLENLFSLSLNENNIEVIRGLDNLKNLYTLFLRDNQISELKGLENLNKLTDLIIWKGNNLPEDLLKKCNHEGYKFIDENKKKKGYSDEINGRLSVLYCRNQIPKTQWKEEWNEKCDKLSMVPKFSDIEKNYQLRRFLRSSRGYMYVFRHPLHNEVVIRHFNGELKPKFTQVFAEIIERINQWVMSHKLLHECVEVELVKEVGEDFIILPFHKSYSTLSAIEDWDEDLIPEELEIMRNILRSEIGKIENEKEKIIEEILVRSLLEPSGMTWFYERINKFIISEPRITQEHLEKWSNLSNE